jgi:hypothetical protein
LFLGSQRDYTAAAAIAIATTAASCIDRGRCSPVHWNNVNQTGMERADGDRSPRLGLKNHPAVTLKSPAVAVVVCRNVCKVWIVHAIVARKRVGFVVPQRSPRKLFAGFLSTKTFSYDQSKRSFP